MTSKRGLQSPWQQPGLNTSYLVTVVERGHLVKNWYLEEQGEGKRGWQEDRPALLIRVWELLHLHVGLIHFTPVRSLRWNDLGSTPGDFHVHARKMAGDRQRCTRGQRVCASVWVCVGFRLYINYVWLTFVGFVAQQIQSKTDLVFVWLCRQC